MAFELAIIYQPTWQGSQRMGDTESDGFPVAECGTTRGVPGGTPGIAGNRNRRMESLRLLSLASARREILDKVEPMTVANLSTERIAAGNARLVMQVLVARRNRSSHR